jgi:cytidine deaminase
MEAEEEGQLFHRLVLGSVKMWNSREEMKTVMTKEVTTPPRHLLAQIHVLMFCEMCRQRLQEWSPTATQVSGLTVFVWQWQAQKREEEPALPRGLRQLVTFL